MPRGRLQRGVCGRIAFTWYLFQNKKDVQVRLLLHCMSFFCCRYFVLPMLTLEGLIAVISLVLTAFGLGYAVGSNNKAQK